LTGDAVLLFVGYAGVATAKEWFQCLTNWLWSITCS